MVVLFQFAKYLTRYVLHIKISSKLFAESGDSFLILEIRVAEYLEVTLTQIRCMNEIYSTGK
jgi:hypothetical protein